ncbi:TPA: hypothetical protein ACPJ1R_004378 [Vibrio alginolyticus]
MTKRNKFQLKKAASKRSAEHLEKITGGMAAVISVYLLAISTRFIDFDGITIPTASIGTFSLVLLVLYKMMSFYEKEGDLETKNPMSILFGLGLTGGLITYVLILSSISWILVLVASITFSVVLFIFAFAYGRKEA